MKKIIGTINPFKLNQSIFVLDAENETLIYKTQVSIDSLKDLMYHLADEYEADEIILKGPHQYNKGLIKPTDFENKKIKITYLTG